jgi:signal transduction histidine kinase
VNLEANAKEAAIRVRDHGPGIPEDHLDTIFEPFHQVTPQSKQSGTAGIGLSIARGVAEMHGGTIEVRNHPEGGSEFTVRLPIATAI